MYATDQIMCMEDSYKIRAIMSLNIFLEKYHYRAKQSFPYEALGQRFLCR